MEKTFKILRTPEDIAESRERFKQGLAAYDEQFAVVQSGLVAVQEKVDTLTDSMKQLNADTSDLLLGQIRLIEGCIEKALSEDDLNQLTELTLQSLELRSALPESVQKSLDIIEAQETWIMLIRIHRELLLANKKVEADAHKADMDAYRKSLDKDVQLNLKGLEKDPRTQVKSATLRTIPRLPEMRPRATL